MRLHLLEYSREVTISRLGKRFRPAMEADGAFMRKVATLEPQQQVEAAIAHLETMDPTPAKKYMIWLVAQYQGQKFRMEDGRRVLDTLTKFVEWLPRLPKLNVDTNLGSYDFHSLAAKMRELSGTNVKADLSSDVKLDPKTYRVLYNGPLGTLTVPLTRNASCELGRGTQWCTAADNDNMFNHYNKQGALYIWRDRSGEKFQFHFQSNQYMDKHDQDIDRKVFQKLRMDNPVLKQLFDKKDREDIKKGNVDKLTTRYTRYGTPAHIVDEAVKSMPLDAAYKLVGKTGKGRSSALEERLLASDDMKTLMNYVYFISKDAWKAGLKKLLTSGAKEALLMISQRDSDSILPLSDDQKFKILQKVAGNVGTDFGSTQVVEQFFRTNEWAEDRVKETAANGDKNSLRLLAVAGRDREGYPDLEDMMVKKLDAAALYAYFMRVKATGYLAQRWEAAEPVFLRDTKIALRYIDKTRKEMPESLALIKRNPEIAAYYATMVTNKRWDKRTEDRIYAAPETETTRYYDSYFGHLRR